MKAIGRNLIIKKEKQGTSETKGGLLLTENQREDLRYNKAKVISVGSEVVGAVSYTHLTLPTILLV